MYLQKLEIQGFKSFAEKTVLEFNRELTAIVGPNGSGKSNIADAVRWVLGEQSLKLLRGKKSQDVIFAGSLGKARLGFAEVSLYLNNEDGRAPIDYREVVITRRIYRDGETEYLLNKNKVRLLDIQLLLAKSSFSQRNYSIIGQGMIDSILTASPTERKEFFDEATGVREYQLKKDQAALKLEHSRQNLAQAQQLLEEIEPRLRSLTRQVKKLERKEEISGRLMELQTEYYSHQLFNLDQQLAQVNERFNQADKNKTDLEQRLREGQKQLDQQQLKETQAGEFGVLQDQYHQLASQRDLIAQELLGVKAKIDLDLVKAGKVDLVWLTAKSQELKSEQLGLEQESERARLEKSRLEKLLAEKLKGQEEVLKEFSALQNKLLAGQNKNAKNSQLPYDQIKQRLNRLYQSQVDFIAFIEQTSDLSELGKIKNRAQELLAKLKELADDLAQADQNVHDENWPELQKKLADFIILKDSLVNAIQELKIKTELVKEKLSNLEQNKNRNQAESKKIAIELSAYQGQNKTATMSALSDQEAELEKSLAQTNSQIEALKEKLQSFSTAQNLERQKFIKLQQEARDLQIKLNSQNLALGELKVELARLETKKEDLEKEIAAELTGNFTAKTKPQSLNLNETALEISRLKNQLAIIGGIDEGVDQEYQEVATRYTFLEEQSTDLGKAIESCLKIIDDLDDKITEQFEAAFKKINDQFEHYFKILFNGGQAKLLLEKKVIAEEEQEPENNQENQVNEINDRQPINHNHLSSEARGAEGEKPKLEFGIEIQATPPGKRLKSINTLSGGEKALTSIALISAIIANNPSPFVILDEVDAALDEANSLRFAKIVEELSSHTQFICVTHNRATMQQAAILYGVTMGSGGISKLLSVNLAEAEKVAEPS